METIILARVSTEEQQEGQSIPAQVARLNEYAKKKNLDIYKTFTITESSTKDTRKKFEQIIDIIKKSKQPFVLIVDTIDRLQRSFKESIMLGDLLKQGKLELHFYRENLTINQESNSADILRWDMGVMFAKSYVLQLSDNVKRSLEQKIKNGEWSHKAPIGYKNIRDENGKSDIIIDPDTASHIKGMFKLYAQGGYSMAILAKEMTKRGLRSSRGSKINTSFIDLILKNPFYYGIMRVKGKEYPHKYKPLITYDLFKKVQGIREGWDKKPVKYGAKPFVFRGAIKCGSCGSTVTPELKKGKYIYYSCGNKQCEQRARYLKESEFSNIVSRILKDLFIPQEKLDEFKQALRENAKSENMYHKDSMGSLQSEYNKYADRISKMYDDKLDGRITSEMYDKKFKEYKEHQQEILNSMGDHNEADKSFYITAERLLDVVSRAYDIFESSETPEKRQVVDFIFQNFEIQDKKIKFNLKEPFDYLMKQADNPEWWAIVESNH